MKKNWYYDLETLHDFFCGVFKNGDDIRIFELSYRKNEILQMIEFLQQECQGLIGYNNINFDSQIIQYIWYHRDKVTANDIAGFAQRVINSQWPIFKERDLVIPNLDIYKILHLDNKNRMVSLKWCQFMTDWPNVEDMPFNHNNTVITDQQADLIIEYCINDVASTEHLTKMNFREIDLRVNLSDKYDIDFMNASNSKIGSELMLKLYCDKTGRNPSVVRTMRTERSEINCGQIIFPYIKFDYEPFQSVLDAYSNLTVHQRTEFAYSVFHKNFKFDYGLGGIHGSLSDTIVEAEDGWLIIDADVASLYPSIAVVNNLYPEHLGLEFAQIYGDEIVKVRLAEKAKGKEGDQIIVAGYKEAANSVYGKSNDNYSWLKDYRYTLATTINGQLMISMLAEKLMDIPDSMLIQINTDGLTIKIKKEYVELYDTICKEWENTTNLMLEYAHYDRMMIRDVNNYIAVYTNGKTKCKGAFEFERLPLHKNKSELIVRKAIFNWFTQGIPVEKTILEADNILDFCIGARVKRDTKFLYLDKNGQEYNLPRTIRYFISTNGVIIKKRFNDGRIHFLDVHPQRGKAWYQTLLNRYENTDTKQYNINFVYYIKAAKDEINKFQPSLNLF